MIRSGTDNDVTWAIATLIANGLDLNSDIYEDEEGFGPLMPVLKWGEAFEPLFTLMLRAGARYSANPAKPPPKTKRSLLNRAAALGYIWAIKLLLNADKDPCLDPHRWITPLYCAASNGQLEVVKYFTEVIGVNPDHQALQGYTPFEGASGSGQVHVVRYLLETHGTKIGGYPEDVMRESLRVAITGGHLETVQLLILHRPKWLKFSLEIAARLGHPKALQCLLDKSKSAFYINDSIWGDDTLLHRAVDHNRFEVVELLLNRGADPNVRKKFPMDNWTPLHRASFNGNVEIVKLLLTHGASVFSKSVPIVGHTPLDEARRCGHSEVISLLKQTKLDRKRRKK